MTSELHRAAREWLAAKDNPTNAGHGHVRPRPDGNRMRCGGPRLCKVCAAEAASLTNPAHLVRGLLAENEEAAREREETLRELSAWTHSLLEREVTAMAVTEDLQRKLGEVVATIRRLDADPGMYYDDRVDSMAEALESIRQSVGMERPA